MNKLYLLIATAFLATACVDDDDSTAEAQVPYYATCDTIRYTDLNDTIYEDLIIKSLEDLKITGRNAIFTEEAKVNTGVPLDAIVQCNQQATVTFENKLKSANLSNLRANIYLNYKDSLGWTSPDQVTLDVFHASFSLNGIYQSGIGTVKTYAKTFQ